MHYKNSNTKKSVKSIIIGSVLSVVITLILFLICSLIILLCGKYPGDILSYITLGIIGISGFIGSYVAGALNKEKGLLIGAITGFIVYLMIAISKFSIDYSNVTIMVLIYLIVLVCLGALGGILGSNKKKKFKVKK